MKPAARSKKTKPTRITTKMIRILSKVDDLGWASFTPRMPKRVITIRAGRLKSGLAKHL